MSQVPDSPITTRRSTRASTREATELSRSRSQSRPRASRSVSRSVKSSSKSYYRSPSRPRSRTPSKPRSTSTSRSSRPTSTLRQRPNANATTKVSTTKKNTISTVESIPLEMNSDVVSPPTPLEIDSADFDTEERPITPGRTRNFWESPEWVQDNPFIHHGYRVDISWGQAMKSFFKLHNETFNVWTHALSCVFMGVVLVLIVLYMPQTGHEVAYQRVTGYRGIDKGIGFVTELFGMGSDEPVLSYHDSMPNFCESYYNRYTSFITDNNMKIGDPIPTNTTSTIDNEIILAPWEFPAQCKPILKEKFNPSLALNLRTFFRNLPSRTREQLISLKNDAKDVLNRVPLPASMKDVRRSITKHVTSIQSEYNSAKHWLEEEFEKHTQEWSNTTRSLVDGVSNELEHAKEIYSQLLKYITPIAHSQEDIDKGTLKHPAFLFKYLDFGEEFLDSLPQWPIYVFLVSAMICFGCSAVFHLFSAVSYDTFKLLSRMDYAGISILIGGSNVPIIYYCFYCNPIANTIYISSISLGCLVTFFLTVHPKYSGNGYRGLRTILFISLGLCGILPFIHKTIIAGFDGTLLFYLAMMGSLYIGGAVVYVTQVPERCFPGHFDIYCSSHQWWHMFVFAAALTHYMGVQYIYNWRILNVCVNGTLE